MVFNGPPPGLEVKVPWDPLYKNIFAKNTAEEIRHSLIPSICYENPTLRFSLYGPRLVHTDREVDKAIQNNKEPLIETGSVAEFLELKLKFEEVLGSRTYRVSPVDNSFGPCVFKYESLARLTTGPLLSRFTKVYKEAKERYNYFPNSKNGKHFLRCLRSGMYSSEYGFVLLEFADCNLQDMLVKTLKDIPICRSTAMQLAVQTLQGINDLHILGFMHRDIRPSNFFVGAGSRYNTILISGFEFAYNIFKKRDQLPIEARSPSYVPKLKNYPARFQSRAYHLRKSSRPIDDIESWIYMVIYFFCPDLLPWRKVTSERAGYNSKCRLINDGYDLLELEAFIRPMLNSLKSKVVADKELADFPYYAMLLEDLAKSFNMTGKEPLDWQPAADHKKPHVYAANLDRSDKAMQPLIIPPDTQDKKTPKASPKAASKDVRRNDKNITRKTTKKQQQEESAMDDKTQEDPDRRTVEKKKTTAKKKKDLDLTQEGDEEGAFDEPFCSQAKPSKAVLNKESQAQKKPKISENFKTAAERASTAVKKEDQEEQKSDLKEGESSGAAADVSVKNDQGGMADKLAKNI